MTDWLVAPRNTARGNSKRKSLQVLLRQYRKSCRDLQDALKTMSDQEDLATIDAAHAPNDTAREVMIAAPVVTLADIAMKLRFFLEVGSGPSRAESPCPWGVQIVKNILRDLDRQKSTRGIRHLHSECVAALTAYRRVKTGSVQSGSAQHKSIGGMNQNLREGRRPLGNRSSRRAESTRRL